MEKFEEMKNLINSLEEDVVKFYEKGNKAAGVRIRKSMQDLKSMAQELRLNVQDVKNS